MSPFADEELKIMRRLQDDPDEPVIVRCEAISVLVTVAVHRKHMLEAKNNCRLEIAIGLQATAEECANESNFACMGGFKT